MKASLPPDRAAHGLRNHSSPHHAPMLATYHNHTTWSDGKGSLHEMLAEAVRCNISELGISDHLVIHPAGKQYPWGIPDGELDAYVRDVRHLQQYAAEQFDIAVRLGVEIDWFPGHAGAIGAAIQDHPFDYLIGAVHEVDGFVIDGSPAAWERLAEDERNEIHRGYWINTRSLAESRLFDIAAHLDLTKKFAQYPTVDLSRERDAALDAISTAGLVVELNTAGWHKPCNDAYPLLEILRECRRRDIPATLSADAHQPAHLLRDFARGAARLREAGYERVARFRSRERWFESLNDALSPPDAEDCSYPD